MSYSCIICLNNAHNVRFFNICSQCNNCYICYNCYKEQNTHKMNVCPVCRKPLVKTSNNNTYKNCISCLYFLRYFIIYTLFVITPSNIIASGLKDNVICSSMFITNHHFYYFIINFTNLITIPYIICFYNFYYIIILFLFCFMNILFLTLFLTNADHPQKFYLIYNLMYLYTFTYFHLLIICFVHIYYYFKTCINKFLYEQNLLNLRIYSSHSNSQQRSRIAVRSF